LRRFHGGAALAGTAGRCGVREDGPAATFIARVSGRGSKPSRRRDAHHKCGGTAASMTGKGSASRTDRWTHGVRAVGECGCGTGQERTGSGSLATGAKGTGRLVPRGSGAGSARTPRRQTHRARRRAAGRAPTREWRSGARPTDFQPVNPPLTANSSKKLNCATKTVDMKVVDETSLYNICKDCPMFFSTV
jgi:hypothetical protein